MSNVEKLKALKLTMDKIDKLKSTLAQQIIASENLQQYLLRRYFDGL